MVPHLTSPNLTPHLRPFGSDKYLVFNLHHQSSHLIEPIKGEELEGVCLRQTIRGKLRLSQTNENIRKHQCDDICRKLQAICLFKQGVHPISPHLIICLTSPHLTRPHLTSSQPTSPEEDPGVDCVPHHWGQLVHPLLEHEHPLEALIKAGVKLLHLVGHPVQVGGAPGYIRFTDTETLI